MSYASWVLLYVAIWEGLLESLTCRGISLSEEGLTMNASWENKCWHWVKRFSEIGLTQLFTSMLVPLLIPFRLSSYMKEHCQNREKPTFIKAVLCENVLYKCKKNSIKKYYYPIFIVEDQRYYKNLPTVTNLKVTNLNSNTVQMNSKLFLLYCVPSKYRSCLQVHQSVTTASVLFKVPHR